MNYQRFIVLACTMYALIAIPHLGQAADTQQNDKPKTDQVQKLADIEVKEKTGASGLAASPTETVIDLGAYKTVGPQTSVIDVLKTSAAVDFRGDNSLDPGVDSVFLRGFDASRFVTAIDGLSVLKTGGRKSTNIVDYSLLPTFLIKEVEILPGPHSARYDSKSIGGVVNMVTTKPTRHESLKPDLTTTAGYASYNTVNSTTTVQGGVQNFIYDLAYRYYQTDGYLRNSETRLDTYYGRFSYLLPNDGFVSFSATTTDTDRQAPVNNPGKNGDFDGDYPTTSGGLFDPYAKPTWNGDSYGYRLNVEQPTPIGKIDLDASTGKENRKRAYYATAKDKSLTVMDTDWWQEGVKVQDEYSWTKNHATTVGYDLAKLYDDGVNDEQTERIKKQGAYLEHKWTIVPALTANLGVRYEDVGILVTNQGQIKGRPDLVERDFDEFMPKSFVTWKMDDLAAWLRDTSLSTGVSKIWRAPDYHGDYNPQGKPSGVYLEPEHGMGYDLILNRRLVKDISVKFDYSFYDIEDYMTGNSTYAKNATVKAGIMQYSDNSINLEEVYRHGIDIDLGGHIFDQLSFNLSYSWQKFENQGDEPAGETELDQRAEHRISAGLRYDVLANTALLLDYAYQGDETIQISEQVSKDVWDFREVKNDAYHTVDFSVQQKLPFVKGFMKDALVTVYVKNIFDEEYFDTSGFPASDRTFGTTLTLSF